MCGCFFVKNESILGQCVSSLLALQSPCKVVSKLTQFLTTDTALPTYMAYPKFLLDMTDLSETARLVYILLLDRARVSQAKGGWADENGNVFIFYPIQDLAKAIHKSEMSVKTALTALEKQQLIFRKRQGVGKANRIYVKLPVDRNLSARQTENCPSDGKKTKEVVKATANFKMFFSLMVTWILCVRQCRSFGSTSNVCRLICSQPAKATPTMPRRSEVGMNVTILLSL